MINYRKLSVFLLLLFFSIQFYSGFFRIRYNLGIEILFINILLLCLIYIIVFFKNFRNFTFGSKNLNIVILLFIILVIINIVKSFNDNYLIAFLGLKIIIYIPLLFVARALFIKKEDYLKLYKSILLLSLPSLLFGILLFVLHNFLDHEKTMLFFFKNIDNIGQVYFNFEIFGLNFYRINSTFRFSMQYGLFALTLFYLSNVAYNLFYNDYKWKIISKIFIILSLLACLTSGTRGNFLYLFLFIFFYYIFKLETKKIISAIFLSSFLFFFILISKNEYFDYALLLINYFELFILDLFYQFEVKNIFLGEYNIGSLMLGIDYFENYIQKLVRYGTDESFYFMIIYGLGLISFFIFLFIFVFLIYKILKNAKFIKEKKNIFCFTLSFIMTILIMLFKGKFLLADPLNSLFWLLIGLILNIKTLDKSKTIQKNKFIS